MTTAAPLNPNALNPPRAVYSVLGNICKNAHQLRDPEIFLSEDDFAQEFHRIIFSALHNLAFSSGETKKIDQIDVDNYLASYPNLYKIWDKHGGMVYLQDSIEHANADSFRSNYDRLKKFALLRHYVDSGIDVTDLYDYKSVDIISQDNGMKTIDKMTLQEILEHYTMKMMKIRDNFRSGQESRDFKAGDNLDTLLDELHIAPEFGYPFQNGLYNAIFRGMRERKFMLRSAGTGTGKTRQALADMTNASCDQIYDIYKNVWISNGPAYPSLVISTELEQREVQTIMLAFISGINEQVIKDGHYSSVIRQRLNEAIQILKRAPIFCVYVDDFSVSDIEMIIERHIIEFGIKFVAFDYIQMTPKLSRSMANSFGSNLREDQILVQFSAALKILANKYDVFIESSTQLNRNSKDNDNRDTTSLRGGSATADKADHGLITFTATQKDHENLKHILERGFHKKPNYSHWVYKNRSGKNACIIWTDMDLGNMREKALFITDTDFNLITNIDEILISFEEEETLDKIALEEAEKIRSEIAAAEDLQF